MSEQEFSVNGTLIWYYYICKRQVWLMAHSLTPDQENDRISQGRAIHEYRYPRDKKEINLGNVRIDLVRSEKGQLVIGEIKKSSRFLTSATRQLQFYLLQIEKMGIEARAELLIPEEKQRIEVTLNEETRMELEKVEHEIIDIIEKPTPPLANKVKWCKPCAYAEFCWA